MASIKFTVKKGSAFEGDGTDDEKSRVLNELVELVEKITSLTKFLYGEKILEAGLSERMKGALQVQLDAMMEYAKVLQYRLKIWGKSDAEIESEEEGLGD